MMEMGDDPRGHVAGALRCAVWGVLNVTPDSFSDGGRYLDPDAAVAHGEAMLSLGATVIDVGGESTRPAGHVYGDGAEVVDSAEEIRRIAPVIERLVRAGATVSVDTSKADVARAGLDAGAGYVNDVSGGASIELLEIVRESDARLVLMHNRGRGEVVKANTGYDDVLADVLAELEVAVVRAEGAGIPRSRLWIDPGLGFAKTAAQSGHLLAHTRDFVATGLPVLVGASRKSFISRVCGTDAAPEERLGGSLAAVTFAVLAGARAVRVHDVQEAAQAVRFTEALAPEFRSRAACP